MKNICWALIGLGALAFLVGTLLAFTGQSYLLPPQGYWRGAIWAPSTMLILSGLEEIGEYGLAKSIGGKFVKLCRKSGFAENFDAVTGKGYFCSAYTWTSSVFMMLSEHLRLRSPGHEKAE